MLVCWSVKGGQGTTVVTAGLGLVVAGRAPVTLVDLAGDLAAVLGVADPASASLFDLAPVDGDEVARVASEILPVGPGLGLLSAGSPESVNEADPDRVAQVIEALPGEVIVDAGRLATEARSGIDLLRSELAVRAERSILVTRACYLSLRRAAVQPVRPTHVVMLEEPGRSLHRLDVEDVTGAPVMAQVPVEVPVARSVDAGLLAGRPPKALTRALAHAA